MGLALFSSWPISSGNAGPKEELSTSLGKSKMYLGMLAPHKNWAMSSEKLLQLWRKRSYVVPLRVKGG